MHTKRVIVICWDGMRPDLIHPDLTPNLHRLAHAGAWYRRSAAVFPTVSRPNWASVSTGAYPGKHGLYGSMPVGPPGDRAPIDISRPEDRERVRRMNGGRILGVATLAEALAVAGKRVAILGTGPVGQATFFNPTRSALTIYAGFTWPEEMMDTLVRRFGPVPPLTVPIQATGEWLTDVLLGYVLPEVAPDVVVTYIGEPDGSQHYFGVGSPQATDAIRGNDTRLGRILDATERDSIPTTVIVVSDHGHSTVNESVDVRALLGGGGFADALADERLHYAAIDNDFTIEQSPAAASMKELLLRWLVGQPWTNVVVDWSSQIGQAAPGSIPVRSLWGDRPQPSFPNAPTVSLSYAWDTRRNGVDVPGYASCRTINLAIFDQAGGRATAAEQFVSMHGSLSPYDLNNTLVLSGAGVRALGSVNVPAGSIDIAPTVLALLGLPASLLPDADGRVLAEAIEDGPDPAAVPVRTEHLADFRSGPLRRHWVGSTAYLDTWPEGVRPPL